MQGHSPRCAGGKTITTPSGLPWGSETSKVGSLKHPGDLQSEHCPQAMGPNQPFCIPSAGHKDRGEEGNTEPSAPPVLGGSEHRAPPPKP